jgi:hydroxyethylthiazole kinase-like uncharacterized protein yjeF
VAIASIDRRWLAERLPPRPERAHKGTFGRLLVVAGSLEYAGAALLVGLGAARGGAGLVCLATPESVGLRLLGLIPELTALLLPEEAPGLASPAGWRHIGAEAVGYDAVVVGPGLGRLHGTLRRTRSLLGDLRLPVVADGDALNALAEVDKWWKPLKGRVVLTPHPVEFARLSRVDEPPPDDDALRAEAAGEAAARWGQVVVLKGACTVVASPDGEVARSEVATPALATAGSGDVLAGAIGAFLAAGVEPFTAAGCAVAAHARAGQLAERRIGRSGTIARDIANLLPEALEQLRTGRETDR